MAVRLQLEGQDLESLLERVQEEYGAKARIVEAEKLRSGGLGGFFAKESFAMTVELDEDAACPDDPSSLLDLVDAASRTEVSTSSQEFGDVMARISRATGDDDFVVAAPPPAAGAAASWGARTASLLPTRVPPLASPDALPSPKRKPAVRAAKPVTAAVEPAEPAARKRAAKPAARAATPVPATRSTARAATKPGARAAKPAARAAVKPAGAAAKPAARAAVTPARAAAKPAARAAAKPARAAAKPATTRAAAPRPSGRTASALAQLRSFGLPEQLLPARNGDLHRSLVASISGLPAAAEPALTPGAVLIVVGSAAAALEAATRLSAELGLDPDAVVLCAPDTALGLVPARRRMSTPLRLAAAIDGAKRRVRPLVIALDDRVATPETGARHGWPTGVVGLVPYATRWGVVSATTKAGDITRWTERVGGLDALLLDDVELSSDPATVLACGTPTARLDGRRASPAAWASLLCERLA